MKPVGGDPVHAVDPQGVHPAGFIDIAWILGFIVSGLVYLIPTRLFGKPEAKVNVESIAVAEH